MRWREGLVGNGAGDERFLALAVRTAALIATFMAVAWWAERVGTLKLTDYEGPSIALAVLRNFAGVKTAAPLLLLLAIGFRRPVWIRWNDLEHGACLRGFVLLAAGILAWTYATYNTNLYLGRLHGSDRLLLVLLAALIWWRPLFVLPFVLLVIPMIRQFSVPLGNFSIVAPYLFVRILMLFTATWLLMLISGRRSAIDFVVCVLALIASNYWVCGLGKLRLGWITYGHFHYLAPAAHANGWLGFLEPETFNSAVRTLMLFDWPMGLMTLVFECGALILLVRRRVAIVVLGGWVLFHIGVFAVSGICFWKWLILDATLLVFFLSADRARLFPVFGGKRFVVSVVLIAGSPFWYKPVALAWYDSRVSYSYRMEATGASGATYQLAPRFFAPHDYQFTFTGFGYLDPAPTLGVVAGALADRKTGEALIAAATTEEIFAIERERGRTRFDEMRAAAFDSFVARFVGNVNEHGMAGHWYDWLRAPPLLCSSGREPAYPDGGERIRKVTVVQVMSDWDGERYSEIRKRVVREIEIP